MNATTLSPRRIVEEANRLLVAKRGLEAVERFFSPDYVEHDPNTEGGNLAGLLGALRREGFTEEAPNDREQTLHIDHVIADGEFVFIHQHITEPQQPTLVFMDLFRVKEGRIVEHWDVIQAAPGDPVNKRVPMW